MINSHLYVAGEMFMRNLDNLYISTAFLGVGGADMHAGYTVNYSTELIVFETIQKLTDNPIMFYSTKLTGQHFRPVHNWNMSAEADCRWLSQKNSVIINA